MTASRCRADYTYKHTDIYSW